MSKNLEMFKQLAYPEIPELSQLKELTTITEAIKTNFTIDQSVFDEVNHRPAGWQHPVCTP